MNGVKSRINTGAMSTRYDISLQNEQLQFVHRPAWQLATLPAWACKLPLHRLSSHLDYASNLQAVTKHISVKKIYVLKREHIKGHRHPSTKIFSIGATIAKHATNQVPDLANAFENFFVRQLSIHADIVPFPVECNLVTKACFHMPVEGIVADVGFSALEPLSRTKPPNHQTRRKESVTRPSK
jgi:hypothetical protein